MNGWQPATLQRQSRQRIPRSDYRVFDFMLVVGTLMILFRAYFVIGEHALWHFIFAFGFVALFFASMMEGYYGGRLNHR
jgi:hypothetical protein